MLVLRTNIEDGDDAARGCKDLEHGVSDRNLIDFEPSPGIGRRDDAMLTLKQQRPERGFGRDSVRCELSKQIPLISRSTELEVNVKLPGNEAHAMCECTAQPARKRYVSIDDHVRECNRW